MTTSPPNSPQPIWNISLVQTYLETARSVLDVEMRSPRGALDPTSSPMHPALPNVFSSIGSIAHLYSYMAIEAYVNYLLYETWCLFRRAPGDEATDIRKCSVRDALRSATSFELLRQRPDMRELPERFKTLGKVHNWPQLYEQDQNLWREFMGLFRTVRHFLIHPFQEQSTVQKVMEIVQRPECMHRAPVIAASVIGHLHDAQKLPRPPWLKKNQLFTFTHMAFPLS